MLTNRTSATHPPSQRSRHFAHYQTGDQLRTRTAAQWFAFGLGLFFISLGCLGFLAPDMMGMHLSFLHNSIHLVSGLLAVGFGLANYPKAARRFDLLFGLAYGLLGLAGFYFGAPGAALMGDGGLVEDPYLWSLFSGALEYGQIDHDLHLLVGATLLVAALLRTRPGALNV